MNRVIRKLVFVLVYALLSASAHSYTVQDPDDGALGDTFLFVPEAGGETGDGTEQSEAARWIEEVREESGLTEPLQSETGKTAMEELEKPPLATDEVRFEVDAEEGWIEYLIKDDTVVLYNDAVVEYQDMVLLAEEISLQSEKDLVVAEGRAVLIDPNQEMIAVRMAYDMRRKKGVAYYGTSEAEMGYYKGKRIKQIGEDEFCIYWGSFTTDELAYPNYRFWSPKIKIYVEDKVIARPSVLFAGEVPVVVVPFYFFYLKKGRRSGIIPPYIRYIEGKNFTVNNGFYWAINDYSDLTLYLDYNSNKGWRKAANFVYLYGSRSTVNNIYISQQRERDTYINWWKLHANHRQDFSDTFIALASIDLRNSTEYDKYFLEDFQVRTQDELRSFFNVSKTWGTYSANLEVSHNEYVTEGSVKAAPDSDLSDDENDIRSDGYFPRVSFSGTRGELLGTSLYYSVGFSADNEYKNGENTLRKAVTTGSLSRPSKLFRYFRVDPSIRINDSVYDRDIYGRNIRNLFKWNAQLSTSTKIYGLFEVGDSKLRHIINPNVTYSFYPEIDQTWLSKTAGISPKASYLSFSLTQNFDIKLPEEDIDESDEAEYDTGRETGGVYGRGEGDQPAEYFQAEAPTQPSVINLFKWTLSTKYDLLNPYKSSNANVKFVDGIEYRYRLGDLRSTVDVAPNFADWYYLSTKFGQIFDINNYRLESWDTATVMSFTTAGLGKKDAEKGSTTDYSWRDARDPYGTQQDPASGDYDPNVYNIDRVSGRTYGAGEGMGDGWNISLAHNYTKNRKNTKNLHSISGAVSFNLTKKWRLGYDTSYDIEEGQLNSEHYRIYRDLRHWEAEIRVSFERSEVIYWFQIRLKDLPEIQFYGTRYRQW